MIQIAHRKTEQGWEALELPAPDEQILPGVPWGRVDKLFSPAFWAAQGWFHQNKLKDIHFRLGKTLHEEVAACVLAGYGMPSEIGLAAFRSLRGHGLLDGKPVSADELYEILSRPFRAGKRSVKYRFARQKSIYLSDYLNRAPNLDPPESEAPILRQWLLQFRGIGLKIASWITRNWLYSDDVAIIDVHVYRAGLLARVFCQSDRVSRDYLSLERRFLAFAKAINIRASVLDCLIWSMMRQAARIPLRLV